MSIMGVVTNCLVGAILVATLGCSPNYQSSVNQNLDSNTVGIFGGESANKENLITKVMFRLKLDGSKTGITCSAARIGLNRYLTAAHCVDARKILVYSYNNELIGSVSKVKIHPNYKIRSLEIETDKLWSIANEFDIAILELAKENISREGKDVYFRLNHNLNHLRKFDVAGFGYENYNILSGQRQGETLLRWTELERKDSEQAEIFVFDQTQGKGICAGDSGGAAFKESETEIDLIGIAVSVRNPNNPEPCKGISHFINIESLLPWIFSSFSSNLFKSLQK